jgi:hypothetical protein
VAAADSMAVSTLRDYVEVLKRRKWVVLLPLVVVPVCRGTSVAPAAGALRGVRAGVD